MKELSLSQMEELSGGSLTKALTCVSQVTGGMGVLGSLAAIGIFSMTPIGWGILALGAISLVSGVIADPTACD